MSEDKKPNANGLPPQAFAGYDRKRLRRFYKEAAIREKDGSWQVTLDGRPIRTPARHVLTVQAEALAEAIAAEWAAQGNEILPETMPLTKLANSAIDGVAGHEAQVREDILTYAASDLLFYRAEGPEGLIRRQAEVWDPVIAWARNRFGAEFRITTGVMPVNQPPETAEKLRPALEGHSPMLLAALHSITTLTGSALLTLAHLGGRLSVEEVWAAAHIDEDWQISKWGENAEAAKRRAQRLVEMQAASRIVSILREAPPRMA